MYHQNHNLSQYEPTGQSPEDDRDPMTQLQVIRIPKEFRARLAEARADYERREAGTSASGGAAAMTVLALLFLAGVVASYFTGLGASILDTLPAVGRQVALVVAVAGAAFSVVWLLYALVRSDESARQSREM